MAQEQHWDRGGGEQRHEEDRRSLHGPILRLRGWRFASFVLGALVLLNLPYAYHWLVMPEGMRLMGTDYRNAGDLYTYVAWMKQAAQGHELFLMLYDPAPQERSLFLPLFLLLGRAAGWLRIDLVLMLHLARIAASALFFVVARWLCRRLVGADPEATRAFLLLTMGSGLPAFIPEACPVSSMWDSAIFTVAWVLILWGGGSFVLACREGAPLGWAISAGLAGASMLLVHPYDAVSLAALVAATVIIRSWQGGVARAALRAAIVAAIMAPSAALVAWSITRNDRVFHWAATARATSGWEVLSFGTLLPLAVVALIPRRRRTLGIDPLVVTWLVTSLLLLFGPVPSQRRYIQGLQAPLAILAARGWAVLADAGLRRLANHLLVLAFPASAVMLATDVLPIIPQMPRYLPAAFVREIEALDALPPGIIMATPGIDYFIPPFSGRQVYAGHSDQTPDYLDRMALFERFARGEIGGAELSRHGIRYVVVDARAPIHPWTSVREIGSSWYTRLFEVTLASSPRHPGA